MEKIVYTYSHDHTNDTTIELLKCPGRTQIEIDFDMEDTNVGKEIAVFGTDEDIDFVALAQAWLDEINDYLDGDQTEAEVYEDYTSNMWYCMANSLDWLINEKLNVHNGMTMTIASASKMIAKELWIDNEKVFSFCDSTLKPKDAGWHGIKRIDTMFDNDPDEFIVAVGHWGGGKVGVGYADYDYSADDRALAVRRAIHFATGWSADKLIYIEEDKRNKEDE